MSYLNVDHLFVYYSGRGQYDKFYGYIDRIYPRIFTVKVYDGRARSISYSDFAIKNLKIE